MDKNTALSSITDGRGCKNFTSLLGGPGDSDRELENVGRCPPTEKNIAIKNF